MNQKYRTIQPYYDYVTGKGALLTIQRGVTGVVFGNNVLFKNPDGSHICATILEVLEQPHIFEYMQERKQAEA